MEYEQVFDEYIKVNEITKENLDMFLKLKGYVSFFNEITIKCLGEIETYPHRQKKKSTSSSLVYLPDALKEKLLMSFDILYVSQLYYGVMTHNDMMFNYDGFDELLKAMVDLRVSFKSSENYNTDDQLQLKNNIIKVYMNVVYGMLDHPMSVIESSLEDPREVIVENAKKVMLTVASFFLNKSMPVFYIDTDELFIPHLNEQTYSELKEYFKTNCSKYIDTDISSVYIDETDQKMNAYIVGKKKMMLGKDNQCKMVGLMKADPEKVLLQNKKYFGRNHKDVFPEYVIW